MKRKIFTLCTALILGASALLASETAVDGIYYDFDDANLTASVTYRGSNPDSYTNRYTGDVVIPATVTYGGKTYSVTSIGRYAFYDCSGLTSVTIPNSVTSIGRYAFYGCSGLTSVTIPNSVTSIGYEAFSGCSGLTSITIPDSVTSIGEDAFYGTAWLSNQPDGVIYINQSLYKYKGEMPANTSIVVREGTTQICGSAFYNCSGLTSVTIPNSVTSIEHGAFRDCSGLTSVVWNAKNCADFSDSNDAPFYDYDSASQITSFTFGEEVEHIPAYLCYGLSSLNAVTIGHSVESIGDYAFDGCSSLSKTNYTGDIAGWCGIYFPGYLANPAALSHNLYINNVEVIDLVIPDGVTSIGNYAFDNCSNITSVSIPNSVTSIGKYVFSGCSGLTTVTIPNSVDSIGDYAFYDCSGVTKFICKGTPTFANDDALTNFPKLDSIAVPAEVFDIPETELVNCPKQVRYIKITSGELSADAFSVIQRNYKVLNTLDIAAVTNTTLADEAFKGCYALESLSLPSELQTIGYMALADCKNLQSIHVPASVTDIDDSAFEDCRSVTSITFGDAQQSAPQQRSVGSAGTSQLRRIGNWGFYNCHNLQSLTIPEGVEKIGTAAFYGCTYLEELSLPSTVQSIGDNCFALASKLTKITVNAVTPPTIEAKTFAEVDRTIPVVVPAGALEAYTAADYWSEFINIEEAPVTAIAAASIIAGLYTESGRIVCEGEFRIYDLLGRDVTHLNGSLCGVYVVKSGNVAVKVVVK